MTKTPVTFIHSSDWQLGMVRHYLSDEAQARFTGDRVHTIRTIGDVAKATQSQFIVVAGDVFEHANLSSRDIGRAFEAMSETNIPIFLLPGNHDPLGPGSIWLSPDTQRMIPDNVTVLNGPGPFDAVPGVEIVAVPWTGKNPGTDPVCGILPTLEPTENTRILVGHGMLRELDPDHLSTEYVDSDKLREAVRSGLVDYVALGDRHICKLDDETGAINYSGTHETTSERETTRGTVLSVTIDDDGVNAVRHEVGTWLHTTIERTLDSSADVDLFAEDLERIPSKDRTIVKTKLKGTLSISAAAALDQVTEDHQHLFASLYASKSGTDLAVVPDALDLDNLDLSGFARDAFDELSERAVDDPSAAGALKLLYRFGVQA